MEEVLWRKEEGRKRKEEERKMKNIKNLNFVYFSCDFFHFLVFLIWYFSVVYANWIDG